MTGRPQFQKYSPWAADLRECDADVGSIVIGSSPRADKFDRELDSWGQRCVEWMTA